MSERHSVAPIIEIDERLPAGQWAVVTDAYFNPVKVMVAPGLEQRAQEIFVDPSETGRRMTQQALLLPCPAGCAGSLVNFIDVPAVVHGYPLFAVECHCGWRSGTRGSKKEAAFVWNTQRRMDLFCKGTMYEHAFELLEWLRLDHRGCRRQNCGPCAAIAKCDDLERARRL